MGLEDNYLKLTEDDCEDVSFQVKNSSVIPMMFIGLLFLAKKSRGVLFNDLKSSILHICELKMLSSVCVCVCVCVLYKEKKFIN